MSDYVVVRDTREHSNHGYAERDSIRTKLDADYTYAIDNCGTIEIMTDKIQIERKQSGSELASNLVKYANRFEREMKRIKNTKFKILLIEDSLANCLEPRFSSVNRRKLLCSLIDFIVHHGIIPIFAGDAEHAEEFCKTFFERIQKAELKEEIW